MKKIDQNNIQVMISCFFCAIVNALLYGQVWNVNCPETGWTVKNSTFGTSVRVWDTLERLLKDCATTLTLERVERLERLV